MSKFGLASLTLVGAHELEDDGEECEWFPLLSLGTFGMSQDGIPMHSSSLSLDRVARSRADSCLRARVSVGNLFRDKFCDAHLGGCEMLISNVTHGSLNPVTPAAL